MRFSARVTRRSSIVAAAIAAATALKCIPVCDQLLSLAPSSPQISDAKNIQTIGQSGTLGARRVEACRVKRTEMAVAADVQPARSPLAASAKLKAVPPPSDRASSRKIWSIKVPGACRVRLKPANIAPETAGAGLLPRTLCLFWPTYSGDVT